MLKKTLLKIFILHGNFFVNLLKKFARKDFFLLFFLRIYLAGNSFVDNYFLQNYKIHKYFLQNLLRKVFYTKSFAKKLAAISCKFFFITKFMSISYKKNQNKIDKKYEFF